MITSGSCRPLVFNTGVPGVQVLASEMYASGVEALEERQFVEAADYLAQCLQFHAERSGDTSVEASVIGLKYAEALLGCARMKGTNVLGTMKVGPACLWHMMQMCMF